MNSSKYQNYHASFILWMLYSSKYQKGFQIFHVGRCHFLLCFLFAAQIGWKPKNFPNKLLERREVHVLHKIHVLHQTTENITTYLLMFANKRMPCSHKIQWARKCRWRAGFDRKMWLLSHLFSKNYQIFVKRQILNNNIWSIRKMFLKLHIKASHKLCWKK